MADIRIPFVISDESVVDLVDEEGKIQPTHVTGIGTLMPNDAFSEFVKYITDMVGRWAETSRNGDRIEVEMHDGRQTATVTYYDPDAGWTYRRVRLVAGSK